MTALLRSENIRYFGRLWVFDRFWNRSAGRFDRTARERSVMRNMRETKSYSTRSFARPGAPLATRVSARGHAGMTRTAEKQTHCPTGSHHRNIPVVAESYVPDRGGYAFCSSGIRLAVTPRGAGATQGVSRLNEEMA